MSIGPSMPLRLEKPEGIDLAQAARYFGARGGADAATQALLEKCAVPLLAAATPRAVWLEADPDSLTAAGILAGKMWQSIWKADPPGRCGRYRRRCGIGCAGLRAGRTGCKGR